MKSSDEIFRLIKSLSKQEKSYFKKFATAFNDEEGSNYLKLFDEIMRQASKGEEYDEDKIKIGKYSGKFLKNLSYHKNYLYQMILNSLLFYHKENKDVIPIRNLISQSEILYDKMLYEQSLKLILRARKLATEKENYICLHEIITRERLINKFILSADDFSKKGKQLFEEQQHVIDILKNTLDYYKLNDYIGTFTRIAGTGRTRNEEEFSEMEKFFENPLLKDQSNAKTFFTKTLFNTLNMHYWAQKHDDERGHYFSEDNVKLWEANFNKINGRFDNYVYALNNLLTSQIRTKRFEEAEHTGLKMKGLEKKFPKVISEKSKVFIYYSSSVLMITKYFACDDRNGLEKHVNETEAQYPDFENRIDLNRRIILYYFLGTSNFVMGNYEKSIQWMGKIINAGKSDVSQDYQCYARIVYLICYYELGYLDSLEYALKSAYHFISKRERIYKYENIILKYLRKSFRLKSKKELDEMFIEMKYDIDKIKDDPFEQNALDAFNILTWLESKIKKVPMMKVNS